jgi:hypothetical protein
MPKTITIKELTDILVAQEEELTAKFSEHTTYVVRENERLSSLVMDQFKKIQDLTERLDKVKTQVKDKIPAPIIVGVIDCSPCMSDPVDITDDPKFDYKSLPCLGEDDVCVSCGS